MAFFTEKQIWEFLNTQLAIWSSGLSESVIIRRAYQQTQVKTEPDFLVTLYPISNNRYGFQGNSDEFITGTGMVHTERYAIRKTLQASVQKKNPNNTDTAPEDIAENLSSFLQSQAFITTLVAADLGIERVTDIRDPFFQDDSDQFEATPNFDFVLTYTQEITSIIPGVEVIEGEVKSVSGLL